MKIGILSMQKIPNYGSFLQAFSLKLQLEKRGHDVYFIDIIEGKHLRRIEKKRMNPIKKLDRYFFKRIENILFYKKMLSVHTEDCENYLQVSKKLGNDDLFDLVVIGSDEVFNAALPSRWGFTTQLFGDIQNAKGVATYAASCGSTVYEDAEHLEIVNEINNAMANIEYISVRDNNTSHFVESITGRIPQQHLDPVFISEFDEYIPKIKPRKPYILIYAYGNRIQDEREISAIKRYAKERGFDILSVGMQQRWCKHNIIANAFELLAYVKNAKCIVTDTFHGTVFAIKYNKKFAVLIRESNKNKLEDLLSRFNLESRRVNHCDDLCKILDREIDNNSINRIIDEERSKSYEYLDMITQERKNA